MKTPAISAAGTERSSLDDVLDCYRRDVDVSLLIENLRKTPAERVRAMLAAVEQIEELRRVVRAA